MKIALINTKGGVAKTTSAIYLATSATRSGYAVEVWDADAQGSATQWSKMAQQGGTPLPFPVKTVNAISVSDDETAEITIIDTPPGGAETIQNSLDAADVVIVPTTPSALDLDRVWRTLSAAVAKPAGVVLTSVEPNTRLLSATKEALEEEGAFLFETTISKRQAIKQAVGEVPDELYRYDELFNEIMEVTK